ncbi:PREDICTED: PDZK1-interacting protein 1 [Phaethon lepturus]|uniref:PDZK1-interacting protein 1 n=1 Tax=Phaethon lepturus TaxID=97097 RepID=UPI000530B7F9|nr:PREDICTED: PDZK1-interacting protein 1 [Phaethon lepturus]
MRMLVFRTTLKDGFECTRVLHCPKVIGRRGTAAPARAGTRFLLFIILPLSPPMSREARGSLQPWSQGVIAVVVFLVLVAIAFVVNRFWCKEKVENVETVVSVEDKQEAVTSNGHEGRYLTAAADFRSKESQHAYENTLEPEERVITTAM